MNIESLERCVIEKNHDEQEQVTYGDKKRQKFMGTATGGPKILASTGLGDGRALCVSQGDITKMNVGAIVNAANQQLAHIGGLARAISEAGGHAIQAESDRIRLMNGDVDVGGVAVTGPGQLSCKYVIHAVGPIWSSGRNDDEGLLQEAIFNSLLEADKLQLKSIAIPALSTGIYKFPVAIATKAIVEAIQIHFQDNPTSSLKEVFVCDNNMSTVQEFSKAVELRFGRSNIEESLVYSRTEKMDYDQEEVDMETSFSGRYGRPEHRGRPFPVEQPGRRGGGSSRINVHYVISEIAKEQVDVIVNTTSDRLDLTNGAVSKSLLQAGGNRIQHECKRNYPNGIRHGEFAVTSGGNLKCQFVFHTCLSGWSQSDQEQELSDLVKACLQRASVEGCGSVAFPALGTGNLKYPADIVARTMYDAVEEFSTSNPGSSIQEVKFVLHHKDSVTIKAFSDYESGSSNGDTRTSARGSRRNRRIAPKDDKPEDGGWETISGSDLNQVFNFGKVKLTVKQGDLTKEKVNCIVNSTNTELDLKMGAVSQELARRGGSDLLNEVALKKDEMRKSGIIITTAKGLKADYIVHVSNDFFNQDWKKIISSSLKKANQIQHASSIAFPALGTGQRSTTPEDIAKKMVEVVVDYVKSSGNSSITDIRVVIFQQDMLIPFITGVHEAMQEGKSGKSFFKKAYNWMMSSGNGGKSENPSEIQDREDAISVKLHFFFDQEYSFEMAVKRLNQHYIENMLERKTTNKILKNPNAVLRMKIWSLRNKYAIQVDYDERYGSVNLLGLTNDVVSANDEVHQIIHDAQREEYESEKAKIVSNFVQWSYIDDSPGGSGKTEYDKNCNQIIENAFSEGKPCVKLPPDQDGTEYIIDFNAMVEYPSHDKKDKVVVMRKEKIKGATFEPPATWSVMKSDCEMIPVQAGNQEYNDVQQKFTATLGRAPSIQQIERVQNKYLWQQYVAKKQQLDSQNPGNQNERELWHGTSFDAVPSIYKHGFNRSYCGKNAVAIGNGVYFAVNSSYSASNTYAVPSPSGHKHIFLARVLTGMFTRGQGGLRVPPVRDAAKHIMFDSVADNPASPGMFVIFNDTQAYPEYLITFI